MNKGTGKPMPLRHFLLLLYGMSFKLKKPPDSVKDLHDSQCKVWEKVKSDRDGKVE